VTLAELLTRWRLRDRLYRGRTLPPEMAEARRWLREREVAELPAADQAVAMLALRGMVR
jgi:hypothetical protein